MHIGHWGLIVGTVLWHSVVGTVLSHLMIFVLVDLLKLILYHLYKKRCSDCKSKLTLTRDSNASIFRLLVLY